MARSTPTGTTGAYRFGRYYDPATEQFLSVDPLVNLTQSAYSYGGDDPVNATDPNGMITCGPLTLGCGVLTDIQNAISKAASWIASHPEDVGLAIGAVALLATGGGAFLEGSLIAGGLLTTGEVASAVSTATDVYSCVQTRGDNQVVSCIGALSGGAAGALATFSRAASDLSNVPKLQRLVALEFGAYTSVSHYALLTNQRARFNKRLNCPAG